LAKSTPPLRSKPGSATGYCKFQLNMFTCKKVTHILVTYGNKHCRAPNEK